MQITKLSYNSSNYPAQLREIGSPPKHLFVRGELPKGHMVAIVGTRTPDDYGRYVTYKLSYDLAKAGIIIVSGLALGLDAMAHKGAIDAGGQTIAVLGTAINRVYPASHRGLAEKILAGHGALISEYPLDFKGHRGVFPARNRIISGLAAATIVTQAKTNSGSLITADFAIKQNRTVLAVPGNITNELSAGPNNLLRLHAAPSMDFSDVLRELNINAASQQPVRAKSKEEAKLIGLLESGTNTSEALIEQSGLSAAQFANIISLMEITGKVQNLGAGMWVRR